MRPWWGLSFGLHCYKNRHVLANSQTSHPNVSVRSPNLCHQGHFAHMLITPVWWCQWLKMSDTNIPSYFSTWLSSACAVLKWSLLHVKCDKFNPHDPITPEFLTTNIPIIFIPGTLKQLAKPISTDMESVYSSAMSKSRYATRNFAHWGNFPSLLFSGSQRVEQ